MGIFQKKQEFTLREFYENPLGKAAHAMQYNMTKQQFNNRYDAMYKSGKKIKIMNACIENGHYLLHLIIPSESERENTYDVVIDFFDGDPFAKTLDGYKVRFFSNCPSFTYTYANVYDKEGMLIKEMKDKYEEEIFKKQPKEKNPAHIMNIDKSLFMALIYLTRNKDFMYKSSIRDLAGKQSFVKFKYNIRNTAYIDRQIKKEQNRIKEEKRIAKEKEARVKGIKLKEERTTAKVPFSNKKRSAVGFIGAKTSTNGRKTANRIGAKKSTRKKSK